MPFVRYDSAMKLLRLLPVLLLASLGLVAACENEKSGGDNLLDVTPSSARLRRGGTVLLKASGGDDYVWELQDPTIGSLSSRSGSTVVYTALTCNSSDVSQRVFVYSGNVSATTNGTVSARQQGYATIVHVGTEL